MSHQEPQKSDADAGYGVGHNETGEAVFLDFAAAIQRYGKEQAKIKNLDEKDASYGYPTWKRCCRS